jgi:hypothetical protein
VAAACEAAAGTIDGIMAITHPWRPGGTIVAGATA